MEKAYDHKKVEEEIYKQWEKKGYFRPEINPHGKSYTILLPPPNANAPLHMGHAMYVVEDILIRYHRMKGFATLFLPGTDHAGIETQYVFEKKLAGEGKSRFDYDRDTLYKMINDYVEENRGIAKKQLKQLGFSLDWSREKYTMDPKILEIVFDTFKKLYKDGLIYRAERLVNYCVKDGTSFSDLEVNYEERKDKLFYIKYPCVNGKSFVTVATTRPETMLGDTAVAVNPNDKRYKKLAGNFVKLPLTDRIIPIIEDREVDVDFGTGAVKITPAHDFADYEMGKRHNLEMITVIGFNGKMTDKAEKYSGMKISQAREAIIEELKKQNLFEKEVELVHQVPLCYKCKSIIEPLSMEQWFVKIDHLAKPAIEVVQKGKLKIFPPRFRKLYLDWMRNIRDWNISRQIVWGPQIPAWYCLDCNPETVINFIDKNKNLVKGYYKDLNKNYNFAEIKEGLQTLNAPVNAIFTVEKYEKCPKCGGENILQETDTFDTWFSSGQWPFTTLKASRYKGDFEKFYPTQVLDTMWDILFFWVARMVMFGVYLAKDIPFQIAHMHSRVVDASRQKMSKSRGNVIDPIDMVDKYGADALRMALVYGTAPASDLVITEDKIRAMRNFSNKLWNMGRFMQFQISNPIQSDSNFKFQIRSKNNLKELLRIAKHKNDKVMIKEVEKLSEEVTKLLDKYDFNHASQKLYEFTWHQFADKYIEDVKKRVDENSFLVLSSLFLIQLKLLHPIMPFVTEELFKSLKYEGDSIMISNWPES